MSWRIATRCCLLGGKIKSSGNSVSAQSITFFAYKTGKMLSREITLEFPVNIEQGVESYVPGDNDNVFSDSSTSSANTSVSGDPDDDEDAAQPASSRSRSYGGYGAANNGATQSASKKGSVQIGISVSLEK